MMMDAQLLYNILLGLAGAMGGWILRTLWGEVKELQGADRQIVDRIAAIDLLVGSHYPRRDYVDSRISELSHAIFTKLDRIEGKLDRKVDKA